MARSKQQKIGDLLEQAALQDAKEFFPDADITKGSGCTNQDGDVCGVADLHVECKNTAQLGKGRSIGKKDWSKIKHQARKRGLTPTHLGFDDDGEIVALITWKDLLGFVKLSEE